MQQTMEDITECLSFYRPIKARLANRDSRRKTDSAPFTSTHCAATLTELEQTFHGNAEWHLVLFVAAFVRTDIGRPHAFEKFQRL